ncbi:unnamed protein product [Arctia plantaginis]|uniref:Myrosinase 1-like n=1 Tax=Arctia plantaginis TaxID=874455 RepID=A0A8S0Z8S8_ARCPL|nr:unnamed protein product [Arctia plantaginis]
MHWCQVVVLGAYLSVSWCAEDWTFPAGFKFGAGTSAYQIEGAWNVSDKGENIWDRFIHSDPRRVSDLSNGDVASDSYHLYETDIEKAAELGLHFYRFSISWSRLLPSGFPNHISEDGKRYYNNLIDGLLAKGIEPMVTLYHWDLPQTLQDLGGWTNPLIANWFADYARVVFRLYGDRVKTWLTINEPLIVCDASYNLGILAPGIRHPDAFYLCNKIVLLAHAKAYRVYEKEFKDKYHGEVSIVNQLLWFEPESEDDVETAELALQYGAGRFSHAIYSKEGGWPPAIEKIIEENSRKMKYSKSIMPAFTQEEIELVRGTYDFYAMNYYTARTVRKAKDDEQLGPWPLKDISDLKMVTGVRPEWPKTVSRIYLVHPPGIRRMLVWLKEHYGDMKFLITENGYPTEGGLDDQDRIEYYQAHLKQLLLAIKEDKINLTHYTAWSLLDNMEWIAGYKHKFGLYEVDFADPQRKRTPRASARYYANVIKANSLNVPMEKVQDSKQEL